MRLTIQYKLFLVMLLSVIGVVIYMAVVIQWSFDRGFLEYVDTIERRDVQQITKRMEQYYADNKSWDALRGRPFEVLKLYAETLDDSDKKNFILDLIRKKESPFSDELDRHHGKKHDVPRYLLMRLVIFDRDQHIIVGRTRGDQHLDLMPILYHGQDVGYVGRYTAKFLIDAQQLLFVKKQKVVMAMVTVAALLITMGLSFPLAGHLTRPVRRLSLAARKLIQGDYSVRVRVAADDEIGGLSKDFNSLAQTLAENEEQRRRWVSDIAHELRTPLNTLRGEIEAVQDGIRQSDAKTFERLHAGVMRLSHLVEDLKSLSLSDKGGFSYSFSRVNFRDLVVDGIAAKKQEVEAAGLSLQHRLADGDFYLVGDRQRLQQLFDNILHNCVAYTDRGGALFIDLLRFDDRIELDIRDSAPGVSDADLPHLCERLYRVEKSRSRDRGGAGLGLAIVQGIVEAHHGSMQLLHAKEGGLRVMVRFPVEQALTKENA